jgi:murein DD-endopeptidase MepM/ murein hydrolase activator NlpD
MRALPWIFGGSAAAAALYYWTRRDGREAPIWGNETPSSSSSAKPRPPTSGRRPPLVESLPGRWVWPVGVWHGRKPEITDGFSSKRRTPKGDVITHRGVDIMYRRQPADTWAAGTPHGTRNFVMPEGRAALAASDGTVWFAAETPRGWTVVLDHQPRKLSTSYMHLSSVAVAPRQKVSAGTPIGIIGADPLDAEQVMHLHFEVSCGALHEQLDPAPLMVRWDYLPDPGQVGTVATRNTRSGGAASHRLLLAHAPEVTDTTATGAFDLPFDRTGKDRTR